MRYDVRDLLGHWVKPRSKAGQLCPHACCRNRRVHPENFPLILPRELLRRAPEEDLIKHWQSHRCNMNPRCVNQVIGEIDRREAAGKGAARRREAAAHRAAERRSDRAAIVEAEYQRAESETRGEMVNAAGVRAGVSARSLFTGSEDRALRYSTRELQDYWREHPRPSAGRLSANPRIVRRARARSDLGRVEYPGGY